MKQRSCLLFLPFLLLGSACGGSANEDDADSTSAAVTSAPVKLVFADARNSGCSSCLSWTAVIDVENLAYEKDVVVVAKYPTDGTYGAGWTEHPAHFLRSLPNGHELWVADRIGGIGTTQLAVRYRVAGREHWDNNGGRDYRARIDSSSGSGIVGLSSPMGQGTDVAVTRASASLPHRGMQGNGLYVDALVKNLAYEKEVSLVYTTDGWNTAQVAKGEYAYGDGVAGERWRLFTYFGSATKIEFAVMAKQAGRDAWDNDYRRNFECHLDGPEFVCSGAALTE